MVLCASASYSGRTIVARGWKDRRPASPVAAHGAASGYSTAAPPNAAINFRRAMSIAMRPSDRALFNRLE
jgi:hypothetical protein